MIDWENGNRLSNSSTFKQHIYQMNPLHIYQMNRLTTYKSMQMFLSMTNYCHLFFLICPCQGFVILLLDVDNTSNKSVFFLLLLMDYTDAVPSQL